MGDPRQGPKLRSESPYSVCLSVSVCVCRGWWTVKEACRTSVDNLVVVVEIAQALEDRDSDETNDIHGEGAILGTDAIQSTTADMRKNRWISLSATMMFIPCLCLSCAVH